MMNASTCADLNAVTSTTGIDFTLGQVTVVYAKAPYIYVQDATGTALVYSNWNVFKRLVPGDVVHSITGTAKLYSNLPELMPTDSMISKSSGTAPAIPDATAAPTTADINKVFIYRDVDMGSQSFPNGSAANKTGTFSGGSVLFRNAWKEAYQFDATKTYDILGCVSIYGSTIQVYAAEITEHHEMGFNPIVIGAEKPSAWGAMYLYYWNTSQGSINWPGVPVEVDSLGWAYFGFPNDSVVNYIWNDGNGTQTVDLLARGSVCQRLMVPQPHISNPQYTAVDVECGSHETQPSDTTMAEPITVRLFPSTIITTGWQGVYLYAWTDENTEIVGSWPGVAVSQENGWYSYTFPANIQDVNIIWNSGGLETPNQTENIMNVTASTCYRLGYRTTFTDDYATSGIHYEANGIVCNAETALQTMYEVNQAADGTPIAVRPLIVTLAKKPYFYVQDYAGTPGMIYDSRNEWTDLAFNDVISGFEGNVSIYNGLKEMVPSISYVDWNVRNNSQGEEIVIPVATSAPTVADMNKVFRFENISFGNASFTTQKKNITVTMANGETFAARNQWGEAYTFDASKTYNFTGCVAVYNGNVQVYATNFVEHSGTTPPQPGEGITVGFLKPADWEKVQLIDGYNGAWTGTDITPDQDGWCYYTFESRDSVYYQWSNGSWDYGTMRYTDMISSRTSICHRTTASKVTEYGYEYDIIPVECGSTEPLNGLKVRMNAASVSAQNWSNLYLYAWDTNGPILGQWPGAQLVNVDGWYEYHFFGKDSVNIVWNDAVGLHAQTHDINGVAASTCYQLGATLGDGYPNVYYDYSVVDCNGGDTIAPQPQQGITVKLLASSVREVYDCNYVNLYAWRTEPDGSYIDVPLGGWPGTSVPLDSATGWYHYTFAPEIQDVNIIWSRGCDGGYRQTQDIMHLTFDNCFQLMRDSMGIIAVGANCDIVEPIVPYIPDTTHQDTVPQGDYHYTMRLSRNSVVDAGWQGVGLYAWIADSAGNVELPLGEWPGAPVDNNEDPNWYSYSFFTNRPLSGMIWNNMSGGDLAQTADIMDVSTGTTCYQLTLPAGSLRYYADVVDCNGGDTIPPQPVEGFTIKLLGMSVPSSWNEVRLYSWTPGVDSALSTDHGLALTLDSLGWYSYTFENLPVVDFLFNNGAWGAGNQTVDVKAAVDLCFALGDPNMTGNNHYPVIDVDCIHPDSITPTPVDTTTIHTVYLTDNITHAIFGMIQVPYGGTAVLPMDSLPYYEGYHFVFWEGLYDGSNVIENVTSDLWMQAKYYITLPEQPVISAIPVRLKASSVPQSWEHVYVYSWTQGAMNEPWPGAEMRMDSTGWYTYRFPAGVQNIDLLFNNGEGNVGNQTVDVDDINGEYCFRMGQPLDSITGYYMVYVAECDGDTIPPQPQPQGMTIRLMEEYYYGGWYADNYIYAWQHDDSTGVDTPLLGEWPGQPMEFDGNGWWTYTFAQEYDRVNIVFNSYNHNVQTVDILNVTESSCFQIGESLGYINNMYVHECVQVDCGIAPSMYHLVYFFGFNDSYLGMSRVVEGQAAVAPEAPIVPGYTFVGWDQDFSHVTDMMMVYAIYQYNGDSIDGVTVRLLPTNGYGWENIYLYAWTSDSLGYAVQPLGDWPGILVPKDSTGWHSYKFNFTQPVNIIWNDGISGQGFTHQTQNILNVSESTCYRLYGRDSIGLTVAEEIDCTVNPNSFHTVAFVDMDFENQLLLMGQVAHGAIFEYTPTIPYHEGYAFKSWVDATTSEEYISTEPIMRDWLVDEMYDRLHYMVYVLDGLNGNLLASGQIGYHGYVNNLDDFIPEHEGYEFIGWTDDLQDITTMTFTLAQFRPITYGNTRITYAGKDGEILDAQNVDLNLPVPPLYEGYTFIGWQVVGGDLQFSNGIMIQATYQYDGGTGAPEVNDENRTARKVIRDDKVYVITPDGQVFSSDGKLVEGKR